MDAFAKFLMSVCLLAAMAAIIAGSTNLMIIGFVGALGVAALMSLED